MNLLQVQLGERPTEYTSIRIDYGPTTQMRKKKKKNLQDPKPVDQTQVIKSIYEMHNKLDLPACNWRINVIKERPLGH